MRWEERLLALFDDLEQQAEGLALAERDAEVAELTRAEYAQVDLMARLHASVSREVTFGVAGADPVSGRLCRVGSDWCLVRAGRQEWVLRVAALTQAGGLSERALGEEARGLGARLGFGSALRGLAQAGAAVVVHRADGGTCTGLLGRVGADFVEVRVVGRDPGPERAHEPVLTPFGWIAAVRST